MRPITRPVDRLAVRGPTIWVARAPNGHNVRVHDRAGRLVLTEDEVRAAEAARDATAVGADAPSRVESRRWRPGRLFLVLLVLTFALRIPAFVVDVFNSDETFLATQAQVLNHGGRLYTDAVDRKPPLVPYVYAATFKLFRTTELWSVRVVAMLAVALTGLLLAMEARRRWGNRAGWIAGVLFVLSSIAFAPQDGQAANFEIFMLPAMCAAILLAREGRGLGAGVSLALATLAKQTAAVALLPVLYLISKARSRRGMRETVAGFTLPIAIVALLVGPGELLFWAVLGNGSYLSVRDASSFFVLRFVEKTAAFVAANIAILWLLPRAWRRRREDADLWLWLLSSCVAVAVGFRFFGHYYLQLLPPLCLLTAGTVVRLRREFLLTTLVVATAVAVNFSISGFFATSEPPYKTVSRYVARHSGDGDRIFVWGHVPEIYWASGRAPATRFPTTTFLTGYQGGRPPKEVSADQATPGAWDEFVQDFNNHPPRFVVDTSPAHIRGSEFYPMSKFPRVAELVRRDYRYVRSIDAIAIYERRPHPTRRAM